MQSTVTSAFVFLCIRMVSSQSTSSCSELGWTNAENFGDSLICSSSQVGTTGNLCGGSQTWATANSMCEAVGARLCTVDEIKDDETRGTGCGLDNTLIWSSSSCDVGFYSLAYGSSGFDTSEACAAEDTTNFFRCCADVAVAAPTSSPLSGTGNPTPMPTSMPTPMPSAVVVTSATTTSISSCDDLGWDNAESNGDPLVCSSSVVFPDDGGSGCGGTATWVAANAQCESLGARLCTAIEIMSDETRGTGCGLDNQLVWSSTTCAETNSSGYLLGFGASSAGSDTTCTSPDEANSYRCCADVFVAPSPSPTTTQAVTPAPTPMPSTMPVADVLSTDTSTESYSFTYSMSYQYTADSVDDEAVSAPSMSPTASATPVPTVVSGTDSPVSSPTPAPSASTNVVSSPTPAPSASTNVVSSPTPAPSTTAALNSASPTPFPSTSDATSPQPSNAPTADTSEGTKKNDDDIVADFFTRSAFRASAAGAGAAALLSVILFLCVGSKHAQTPNNSADEEQGGDIEFAGAGEFKNDD